MRQRITAALVGLAVAGYVAVGAQQPATLTLKSGTQLRGDLIDLGAAGFAISVEGQTREVGKDEVLMVDFGTEAVPHPSQLRDLQPGQHLALLRNGEVVVGEFYDIGGRAPLRLTFRTSAGERQLTSADVRRIYLGKPADLPGGAGAQPSGDTRTISVAGTQAWTSTGITVRRGQRVRFEASGEIALDRNGALAGPGGSTTGMRDRNAPIPNALTGTLIGRVGPAAGGRLGNIGQRFVIGNNATVTMPADGILFLGINDSVFDDNGGAFEVQVTVEGSAPVRRR